MIHVIIPVYNRLKLTITCIKSIKKQDIYKELNIIVVDDNSSDGTSLYLKKKYPEIKILNGSGFLFWGGCVSLGVKYVMKICSAPDWVLLINNDIVLSNNSISSLLKTAKNSKRKSIVGGLTINLQDKQTIIKSGTIIKSWFLNITHHVFKGLKLQNIREKKPIEVDFLTGRCLLHPVEIFFLIGNYDSKTFPHYGADDEFSYRVKKIGYKSFIDPSCIIYLNSNSEIYSKKNFIKRALYILFNIKSSSNIMNKLNLTIKVVPLYAKFSFFIIGVVKSIYVLLKK